jgi:hypothetical protein
VDGRIEKSSQSRRKDTKKAARVEGRMQKSSQNERVGYKKVGQV